MKKTNTKYKSPKAGQADMNKTGSSEVLRWFDVWRLAFVFLLLSLVAGCAASPEERKEAGFHYQMGISYLNEGNTQSAFVELQKAMQLNPDNKDVLNSLGLVYLRLEDSPSAEALFLRAVSIDHLFSDAYNNLGVAYMGREQWSKAVDAFRHALANPLYQTPERAFYNLGISYYREGNYPAALDAFKDAVKRSPSSVLPLYRLALVYNKTGHYGDAASVMARAIEADRGFLGDRTRFMEDVRQKLVTARGGEEKDLRDYLEILKY